MGFTYNDDQSNELSTVVLAPGQLSKPLVLRVPAPNAQNVFSAIVYCDEGVLLTEQMAMASYQPSDPYRVFELVGASPGTWTVSAIDVPRTGEGTELASLSVSVPQTQDSDPDLVFRGTYLAWLKSLPQDLGPGPFLFNASSGLPGSQVAREQSNKDHGPIPEGTYSLLARLDPLQASVADANKRQAIQASGGALSIMNVDDGVQYLPIEGNGPVYPEWGTLRVRLTPVRGQMFGRSGFYLHNSHKGYSHGCIEVGRSTGAPDFFASLIRYGFDSKQNKSALTLGVTYTYPGQTTAGATLTAS